MTYYNQFSTSQPCEPHLCRQLHYWIHGWMLHDSRHEDRFGLSADRTFCNSYDITDLTFHWDILLLILFLLSHFTLIDQTILSSLVVLQPDLKSSTCTWLVWLLHIHTRINLSHTVVTPIKLKLTHSTIGNRRTFLPDMTSTITTWLSIPRGMLDPATWFCPDLISIYWWA